MGMKKALPGATNTEEGKEGSRLSDGLTALPLLSSPKLLKFKTLLKLITLKTERDGDEHQTYQVQKSS